MARGRRIVVCVDSMVTLLAATKGHVDVAGISVPGRKACSSIFRYVWVGCLHLSMLASRLSSLVPSSAQRSP